MKFPMACSEEDHFKKTLAGSGQHGMGTSLGEMKYLAPALCVPQRSWLNHSTPGPTQDLLLSVGQLSQAGS